VHVSEQGHGHSHPEVPQELARVLVTCVGARATGAGGWWDYLGVGAMYTRDAGIPNSPRRSSAGGASMVSIPALHTNCYTLVC